MDMKLGRPYGPGDGAPEEDVLKANAVAEYKFVWKTLSDDAETKAKAHVVMADEPQPDQGAQAWTKSIAAQVQAHQQSTNDQLRQLMGLGLLRKETLVEIVQRQVPPPQFSPKPPPKGTTAPPPEWKLDPVTGHPKRMY